MDQSYIECRSLCKQFKGRTKTINAVSDVSFTIERGEFVILRGRSGAGKSTLLNLIGGLIRPSSGSVRINGKTINELSGSKLSDYLINETGFIFQSFNLLPTYDVYENVEAALVPKRISRKEAESLILPCFDQFGLADKIRSFPEELSVGQQQKVAIIRTLVKQPALILADEPTASVDEETATEIMSIMQGIRKQGKVTVIVATHGLIQDSSADRIMVMDNGSLKK